MLRLTVLITFCSLAVGCSGTGGTPLATASVPATDATSQMIGKWGTDGEASLIVSLEDDRIVCSALENDTWRMDISDASASGKSVAFVQENFLHSGESHPFNGVACETTARMIDAERMEMTMTTLHSPDLEPELLARIE